MVIERVGENNDNSYINFIILLILVTHLLINLLTLL